MTPHQQIRHWVSEDLATRSCRWTPGRSSGPHKRPGSYIVMRGQDHIVTTAGTVDAAAQLAIEAMVERGWA